MAIVERPALPDVLRTHQAAWARALAGEDARELTALDDLRGLAASNGDARAAIWLGPADGAVRRALADAARGGVRLVAAGDAELADELGGALVPAAGTGLVCANVPADEIAELSATVGPALAEDLAGHIARLEQAIAALQTANTRLAREQLGRHDAAAATVVGRLEQQALAAREEMLEWQRRFEYEQALALQHHQWMKALESKLNAPHHRAAEKLYQLLLRVPGMRLLFKRVA